MLSQVRPQDNKQTTVAVVVFWLEFGSVNLLLTGKLGRLLVLSCSVLQMLVGVSGGLVFPMLLNNTTLVPWWECGQRDRGLLGSRRTTLPYLFLCVIVCYSSLFIWPVVLLLPLNKWLVCPFNLLCCFLHFVMVRELVMTSDTGIQGYFLNVTDTQNRVYCFNTRPGDIKAGCNGSRCGEVKHQRTHLKRSLRPGEMLFHTWLDAVIEHWVIYKSPL